MTIREIYIKHKRPIIIGVVIIALALVAWFVFRHIEDIKADSKAERELLLRQRKEKEAENEAILIEKRKVEDSLYMARMGIKTRVLYKIIEREKYVIHYLDTASRRTKQLYADSLLGPK